MEILITSKTHKGNAACVGGILLSNNRLVRLLNPGNWDQYSDTNFDVGDVWDIEFYDREEMEPPHIEDIIIQSENYIRDIGDITKYIKECGVTIFQGGPSQIFNGLLGWTQNGGGYIGNKNNLPDNSVGFWISDKDLILDEDEKHYIYSHDNILATPKRFPYVGFAPTVEKIPQGTLMRMSLARWWKPENSDMSERCYLQLSGWYGIEDKSDEKLIDEDNELPF